jgi:hypothetical protein
MADIFDIRVFDEYITNKKSVKPGDSTFFFCLSRLNRIWKPGQPKGQTFRD